MNSRWERFTLRVKETRRKGSDAAVNVRRAFGLVWEAHRPTTLVMAGCTVIGALLPAGQAWVGKLIVDAVVAARWADPGAVVGPGKPIPFPTITVCNYVGCNVYVKWFEHLADISGSKLFMLDVPFARTAEPTEQDIRYVTAQLKELIALCESVSGKKFDIDELREILAHAARAEEGYARAKELCKNHPAPFDAYFDAINMMGPINVLRGTREAADFFDTAVKEFEGLVAQGLGPLSEERFRTVVEGPPPYPFYKSFRNLFSKWGAVGVASTYSTVGGIWEFGFRHDPRRPLESIAEQMLRENLTNRSIVARYAQIKRYVEEWKADALVIHSIKSCRLFSAGQGDMREYFTRDLGVPTLMVESDLEDPRYYAEAQIRNRIDAFFESLEHKKLVAAAH